MKAPGFYVISWAFITVSGNEAGCHNDRLCTVNVPTSLAMHAEVPYQAISHSLDNWASSGFEDSIR